MFDAERAKQSGVPEDEIMKYLSSTRNYDWRGATKAGVATSSIINYLKETEQNPVNITPAKNLLKKQDTEGKLLSFGQRLKMSFGSAEEVQALKQAEESAGLRGKIDVGDIADVAGSLFPIAGAIIGGAGGTVAGFGVGAVPGAAIGAAAGESVKQAIGRALGVRDERSIPRELLDVGITLGTTYAGGKLMDKAFNAVFRRLPERLYSGLFKNVADDISDLTKSEYLVNLQKTNPQLFDDFVKNGIISVKDGAVELNKTLAREVLESGLRGNPRSMMSIAYGKMLELENQVQKKVVGQMVNIKNKDGYVKLLQTFVDHFEANSYGFNPERLTNAKELIKLLQATPDENIPASTALWMRRFIDSMRNSKSFRADTTVAPKQEAFRTAANDLRGVLAKQVGLGGTMNKYRIYIEAFDSLAEYAARTENRALLNLTDAIIGGGGLASGFPGTGLGLMFTLRAFQQPFSRTSIGQGLFKTGNVINKLLPTGLLPTTAGQQAKSLLGKFMAGRKEETAR